MDSTFKIDHVKLPRQDCNPLKFHIRRALTCPTRPRFVCPQLTLLTWQIDLLRPNRQVMLWPFLAKSVLVWPVFRVRLTPTPTHLRSYGNKPQDFIGKKRWTSSCKMRSISQPPVCFNSPVLNLTVTRLDMFVVSHHVLSNCCIGTKTASSNPSERAACKTASRCRFDVKMALSLCRWEWISVSIASAALCDIRHWSGCWWMDDETLWR